MSQPIPQRKHHKGARYSFCAPFINLLKLCRISQSKVFRKCVRSGNRHDWKALIVLDRHPLSALIPSRFQNEPAAPRLHAFAKSVRFRAAPIVRLVCPLWHSSAPSENFKSSTEALEKAAGFIVENPKWKCYASAAHPPN